MAISKTMKRVLKALSFDEVEVEKARQLADLKALDPLRIFNQTIDYKVYNEDYQVPMRIYLPYEKAWPKMNSTGSSHYPVLLFFHGGGWVTDSVDNYDRICARMANATEHIVISVEYRLAPEHKFPTGLNDCYAVAKALYNNKFLLNIDPDRITLIGDSAGGNLTAAISLLARDRQDFYPKRQILIYPAVNSDFTESSPFESVHDNGSDYLLTAGRLQDYINLYAAKEEDKTNPYFAPLYAKDYSHQPRTLIITAEYDPLRDEGEEYGRRLQAAGNEVETHRIKDALHGFFALGIKYFHVQESFEIINNFLQGV